MKPGKIIIYGSCFLFGLIAFASLFKSSPPTEANGKPTTSVQEIVLEEELVPVVKNEPIPVKEIVKEPSKEEALPEANRIAQLFATDSCRLPIVETITYTSRVPWLKGRPAWIADYASHFSTSRHFIARSLNKSNDYYTQKISPGDKFNVFQSDKEIEFYLVIDLTRCKMWFYYLDKETDHRVLLKTYNVGVGRKEAARASGYLTPTGKYSIGSKIAIYKPGTMGYFLDQKTEMISVFGTRWIPFEEEIENCSEGAKGYGIHGTPWVKAKNGEYVEDKSKVTKKYDSDGCVRLATEDVEELFSIIITKPTTVELVHDFYDATLPGKEQEGEHL